MYLFHMVIIEAKYNNDFGSTLYIARKGIKTITDQDQDQDSLLMKRRNDNHSPGLVIRELVPSSHQRSELSNTILCIRAVSPEPSLLAYTSSESRGAFRQKARSQAPLNGWACAVKTCHDGMLEDTNSLDGAHIFACYSEVLLFIA